MCLRFVYRRNRIRRSLKFSALAALAAAVAPVHGQISISEFSNTDWTIGNGDLNLVFNPSGDDITSVAIGASGNLLDTSEGATHSILYQEFAGTPFGAGAQSSNYQIGPNGSYIDFWTTTASTGTSTNPLTYSFHYVLFKNDPNIVCYEVLNHAATDPATSVGQGQFIMRFNTGLIKDSYQYNVGPNNPGPQTSIVPPTNPSDGSPNSSTVDAVTGRDVTNATYDLTGSGLAGDWGSNFNTKYDFATYYQFLQAQTEYGPQYAISNVYTSLDTVNGGPTHQDLTSTNLALIGFLSGHLGDFNYSYTPPQGVNSTRLFGPFAFRVTTTNGESGAQLYQDAVNEMPGLTAGYDTDQELIANSYVPTYARGSVQINAASSAGWSGNINNNTVVLSDPNRSFQESEAGYQYWTQLSANGAGTINDIVPGTYRMSLYQLGQWGETRIDGVQVTANQIDIPQNVKFTPENFGTSIWTIGTPDRSAHEFLNGGNVNVAFVNHNAVATPITNNGVTPGGDLRQYYGNYNYWLEEQELGTPGYVSYYATAVGNTPATNNPLDWIANQWGEFNPGIYDPNNNTTDGYSNGLGPGGGAPAYVMNAGGPAAYKGQQWQVNFTVTQPQLSAAAYKYVDISVGLASVEGSLTLTLNGQGETWHFGGATGTPINIASNAMIRSGDSGTYQFIVYEFPVADLSAAGAADQLLLSASQNDGVMYDALRMELSVNGANPSTTRWHDYEFLNTSNAQTDANNSLGLVAFNSYTSQPNALTWNNANASGDGVTWDTSNQNWNTGLVPATYADPSPLAFNDANNGHYDVMLNTTVSPGSILVNNNAGDYVISGSGGIAGSGSLTKIGSRALTLDTVNTYGGGTNVNAGSLVVGVNGALPNGNISVSSVGKLILGQNTGAAPVQSLTVAIGGSVDVGNNVLAINYSSFASDPAATIRSYLQSGYNNGSWTGTGITSSNAAANPGLYAVGYADGNTDIGTPAAANQILAQFTLAGDANLDGIVNFPDLLVVAQNYGKTTEDWAQGDFNYDGIVNFPDLLEVAQNYGQELSGGQLDQLPTSFAAEWQLAETEIQTATVPEPASALLMLGTTALLARRRDKPLCRR